MRRFGISKNNQCLPFWHTFQYHWTMIEEAVSKWIMYYIEIWKVYTNRFISIIILFIVKFVYLSVLPHKAQFPSSIERSLGRSTFTWFIQIHSIPSNIVDKGPANDLSPNVIDCRFGRSSHSNIQYQFNTSNHKWTPIEIVWITFNCSNLNGL